MESVKVPQLGKVDEVTLVEWKVEPGTRVTEGLEVAEVETMKTSFSVEAPADGIVKELSLQEGDKAKIGEAIARLEVD